MNRRQSWSLMVNHGRMSHSSENFSSIALWQTLLQCDNQFDNYCENVTLHCKIFNIALWYYKNLGLILRFIILGLILRLIIFGLILGFNIVMLECMEIYPMSQCDKHCHTVTIVVSNLCNVALQHWINYGLIFSFIILD